MNFFDKSKEELVAEIERLQKIIDRKTTTLEPENNIDNYVTQTIHESLNLQEVLENAADVLIKRIDKVEMLAIYMVEGRNAVLKCQRGFPKWFLNKVRSIKFPNGFTWKTIIDEKIRYIPDATKDEYIGSAGIELGTKSYASMPLTYKNKVVGVININSLEFDAYSKEEINILENIANHIQSAVNNARQADAYKVSRKILQRKNKQLAKINKYEAIVNEIAGIVHESINFEDVLENSVNSIKDKIDIIEHISILLVEGDNAVMKAYRGHPDWFIERIKAIPKPKGFVWKTIIEKKPIHCSDVDKDDLIGPAGREVGTKSYVSVPLFSGSEVVGCIAIHSMVKNAFDEDEVNLLQKVAKQIETAISNAKYAEALMDSEQKYRALFNESPIGVYLFDTDLIITECNERFSKIIGSSKDVIVGLDMKNLNYTPFNPLMELALDGEIGQQEDLYETTTSNKRIWLSLTVSPLRDALGNITGGIAVVEDITDRKIADQALMEREKQLRLITDSLPAYISYVDKNLCYQFNNAKYETLHNASIEQMKGKHIKEFLGENYFNEIKSKIEKVFSGQKVEFENVFLNKNNEKQISKCNFTPDFDEDNNVVGFHVLVSDITASKKLEEDLLRAQKLESLGILAGGIAHDFNNLLTGILGNISLVKLHTKHNNKNYKRLDEAEKVSYRAKDLTQQLLTFSKGGVPIKQVISSLGNQIKETANFAATGTNVICEYDLEDDLNAVEVDEGQISQVINNIIINALQSMPDGGKILIKAYNKILNGDSKIPLEEGNYVLIQIIDNGVGISEDNIQKIYDPYFTTKQRGSGLGLTTVYSIVKNHDGYIDVQSRLGIGTKFSIYLPVTNKEEKELVDTINNRVFNGSGKILVMDDEALIHSVLEDMLSNLGFEADFAFNGYEACEMYKLAHSSSNPYDLVIMDLTIPGSLGGADTLKVLKEYDSNINAIVSSGYSNDPVIANYREYGFKGIISKPYKVEELSKVLSSFFLQ